MLCVAFFGVQFLTEEGRRVYEEAGIDQEMSTALDQARGEGLLVNRPLMSPEGPLLMQQGPKVNAPPGHRSMPRAI